MADDGLTIDGTDCTQFGLKPPLVSVVITNWNYARFVGAAIDSIREQDYPHFECLIIDNGSTDDSRAVITRHIDGDARFSVLFFDKNQGMMGAWQAALDRIGGEFVTFLDSDDVKFPHFISSHVQVHLALRLGIGFTSSRVVEIDADDRVINGSNLGFGFIPFDQEPRGLKPRETVPRITTIGDADYDILDKCTAWIGPEKTGWYWAPSSANVYRRGIMNLARPDIDAGNNFLFGDVYFCIFCHILAGSAVIDRTLSAYRIHGESAANTLPSMAQMRTSKKTAALNAMRNRQVVLRTILARADSLGWSLKDRYWHAVDQQSCERGDELAVYYENPEIAEIFTDYLAKLTAVFGIDVILKELGERFPSAESRFVILRRLLTRASDFDNPDKVDDFWRLVDWCAPESADLRPFFARTDVTAMFLQNYESLVLTFGAARLRGELQARYEIKHWRTLVWRARRNWLRAVAGRLLSRGR